MKQSHKDFAYVQERRQQIEGTTRVLQYFQCSCSDCLRVIEFPRFTVHAPPAKLAKKAQRAGWKIDLRAGKHLCPDHAGDKKCRIS